MGSGGPPTKLTADRSVEALLRDVPFLRTLDRLDLARLLGTLIDVQLPAGTTIFEEGAAADGLYLLVEGTVEVELQADSGTRPVHSISAPAYFGELGILLARRTGSARAAADVRMWKLPRDRFEQLLTEKPAIGAALAASTADALDRTQRRLLGAPYRANALPAPTPPPRRRSGAVRLAGGGLALVVPLVLLAIPPPAGLSPAGWHVVLLLLGAAIAWLFEPVPDFVVALLLVAAWDIVGAAPLTLSLSGFASSNWIVALAALTLAVAMIRSGLLLRLALRLIMVFPNTHAGNVLALLFSGVLMTPLVPLGLARVAAVAPFARELSEALGYPRRSRATASLAFAALLGYGMFSSIFFSGLAMNFFVHGLLPPADRARFDWITWLLAAAPTGVAILTGSCIVVLVVLRPEVRPTARPDTLRRQAHALASLQRSELITIAAIATLLIGFIVQPVTHVDITAVAMLALAMVIGGRVLDPLSFRSGVDWGFLILFGSLLGAGAVLHHAGVDVWVAGLVTGIPGWLRHPELMVLGLALFVMVCRLLLPWIPATLMLSVALVPAAAQFGVAPWVVGFVVLVVAITWLIPNQSDFCRLIAAATDGDLFTPRHALIVGAAITGATLAGVAISVPYWRALGLVGP